MAYRVSLTDQAHLDLADLFDRLMAQQAGEAGILWLDRLQEAMQSLSNLPDRCRLAPESKEFRYEVRELIYGRKPHFYRVLFTIDEDTVVILHIRHARRLPLTKS